MNTHTCTNPDAYWCHHCDGEKERELKKRVNELIEKYFATVEKYDAVIDELIKHKDRIAELEAIEKVYHMNRDWIDEAKQKIAELEHSNDMQRERIIEMKAERAEIEKARDHWKWEYENLCKFATAFEEQRDRYRSSLEKIAGLGIYCCDDEGLGAECEAVLIAREALNSSESPKGST